MRRSYRPLLTNTAAPLLILALVTATHAAARPAPPSADRAPDRGLPSAQAEGRGQAADPITALPAADTLDPAPDPSPAAQRMIEQLAWPPARFAVTVQTVRPAAPDTPRLRGRQAPGQNFRGQADRFGADAGPDAIVRLPSPRPRSDDGEQVNTIRLEWFVAQHADRTPLTAPAVLILHNLGDHLFIARAIARRLADRGVHGFVMHLPGFAARPIHGSRYDGPVFFELGAQAVADARRARDAIAALPRIAPGRISIQGTSLGGFIAASAAALDTAFEHTFLMLAGGDLYQVFRLGSRDTRRLRRLFERHGLSADRLRELCDATDPLHLAHRLDPQRTWLLSAAADRVVPPPSARALADAARLDARHHIWLPADHYTAVFHLPWAVDRMLSAITAAHADAANPEP